MQVTVKGFEEILYLVEEGKLLALPHMEVVNDTDNVVCVVVPIDSNNAD